MSDLPEPSQWFINHFGDHSAEVMLALANAGRTAHERSLDAKVGSKLTTDEAYGSFWVILPQEVVSFLDFLPAREVIRPSRGRYDLVVFEGTLILPAKCARGSSGANRIKLGPSALRNRALALEGVPARPAEDQLDFGLELDGDLDAAIRDGSFGSAVRAILVAYDTSAQGGLQNVHVGDATLDSTGLVNWQYSEKLPLHLLGGPGAALAGLGGTLTTHFDDAPLPSNELTLRRSSELPETEDIGDQRSNGRLDDRT